MFSNKFTNKKFKKSLLIWDKNTSLSLDVVYVPHRKKEALDCLDGPLEKLPSSFLIDGPHKNPMHSKVLIP